MNPIELSEQWQDCTTLGERTNALLREDRLILNECARLSNAGELDDVAGLEDFRDLVGQSIDVERKYAAARWAEFAETQRQWHEHAFGPDYERELGWDRTSSYPSRRIS